MSNITNHANTQRKPSIDYMLVEEFIEQRNLAGKSCGMIEKMIYKFFNRKYSRASIGKEIRIFCAEKGITMKQIQSNAVSLASLTYKTGYKHTEEARRKMSQSRKGKTKSELTRQHMRDAWKRRRMHSKDVSDDSNIFPLSNSKNLLEHHYATIADEIDFI
jgi:hypothetical protein